MIICGGIHPRLLNDRLHATLQFMTNQENLDAEVIEAAGGILWRKNGGQWEVAIVHRPKYDDWTLPKGKREIAETWQETALREVREETGCVPQLEGYAGSLSYSVHGVPKVILFWNMSLSGDILRPPDAEVDKRIWLSPEAARARLTYPGEQELLARQPLPT